MLAKLGDIFEPIYPIPFPDANPTVVETTEESIVEDTIETFYQRFEETDGITLRKPGYSCLLATLQQEFDDALVENFEAALREAKEPSPPWRLTRFALVSWSEGKRDLVLSTLEVE